MPKLREDKVKSLRVLKIDSMIRRGEYPNATRLCRHFEVSRSTVMRDLVFLRDRYSAPLKYDPIKNGFYYSDPTFFIRSVMLSESELFTVSVIIPLLEQYKNTPLEASFKSIFRKIADMLPGEVSVDSFFASGDIKFISDPLPIIENEVFNTIFKAIRQHLTVGFSYRSLSRKEYIPHRFDPYKVICHKGNWYVIGHCHEAGSVRIYSLARIKGISCSNEHFEMPCDFDIANHVDPSFGVWNNTSAPTKIELLFSKNISNYALEHTWHAGQVMQQNPDGTVYLSFESNQMQESLFWILRFGSDIKVLNPPELVKMVKEEAKKMLKNYGD